MQSSKKMSVLNAVPALLARLLQKRNYVVCTVFRRRLEAACRDASPRTNTAVRRAYTLPVTTPCLKQSSESATSAEVATAAATLRCTAGLHTRIVSPARSEERGSGRRLVYGRREMIEGFRSPPLGSIGHLRHLQSRTSVRSFSIQTSRTSLQRRGGLVDTA